MFARVRGIGEEKEKKSDHKKEKLRRKMLRWSREIEKFLFKNLLVLRPISMGTWIAGDANDSGLWTDAINWHFGFVISLEKLRI